MNQNKKAKELLINSKTIREYDCEYWNDALGERQETIWHNSIIMKLNSIYKTQKQIAISNE